jgi:hypothetical protein
MLLLAPGLEKREGFVNVQIKQGLIRGFTVLGMASLAGMGLGAASAGQKLTLAKSFAQTPLYFESNVGQISSSYQFVAHGSGVAVLLSPTQINLLIEKADSKSDSEKHHQPSKQGVHGNLIKMELRQANAGAVGVPSAAVSGVSNYFKGKDSSKWIVNVPHYGKVDYQSVYPGISLSLWH